MKNFKVYITVVSIVAIIVIFFSVRYYNGEKEQIKQWAIKNHYSINDINLHWTPFGTPFNYVLKGEYIFKVDLTDEHQQPQVWWVRTSYNFGDDYVKENK